LRQDFGFGDLDPASSDLALGSGEGDFGWGQVTVVAEGTQDDATRGADHDVSKAGVG